MSSFLQRVLFTVIVVVFSSSRARALTVDPGGPAKAGVYSSAGIVDGRPAIAYSDDKQLAVKFVRAMDSSGKTWGAPVTVDNAPRSGFRVCLRVVNGNPAVCYFDAENLRIKYARATDAAGSAWGAPVRLNAGSGSTSGYSLEVLGGNPAICYDGGGTGLEVIRASNTSGTAWGSPVNVDFDGFESEPCMTIVDGFPAIAYATLFHLRYVRATDAAGTGWGEPVNLSTLVAFEAHGINLHVVNGRPAVSFSGALTPPGDRNLWYFRATDATGTAWMAPFSANSPDTGVQQTSLAVVQGKPAIGYLKGALGDLKYVQALDANGDSREAWGAPVTADSFGNTGISPSLLEVDGAPALVYHHGTRGSLEFLRATDESGGTRWPVTMLVESPPFANTVSNGGEAAFGACEVGKKKPLKFAIRNANSGSSPLTNILVSLDGADAAEFAISVPLPVTAIAGGTAWEFEMEYRPVKAGVKTAALHIASMTGGVANPSYDIALTASSLPGLQMLDSANRVLNYGSVPSLPLSPPGSVRDFVFTIRNPGTADLEIYGITIDGPDAAEFSVRDAAASPVPPGGSTSFTIRHATVTGGRKHAWVQVSHNGSGGSNPFLFQIRLLPGLPDPGFNPPVFDAVNLLALQADGKILTIGEKNLERWTAGGEFDVTFFPPAISDGSVACLAVQKDGRILIGGAFSRVSGHPAPALARLEADGSVDTSFVHALSGFVTSLLVLPDGKIVAGNSFTPAGGGPALQLVRLHPDGSLDTGFTAPPVLTVRSLALEPDGRILAGQLTSFSRFNADGSLAPPFVPFGGEVLCLAVQSDGNILACGKVEPANPGESGGVKRFFPDGQRDDSYFLRTLTNPPAQVVPLVNGKCIISGNFNVLGGAQVRGVALVLASGTVDAGFFPRVNGHTTLPSVSRALVQADGKILLAGQFSDVDGSARQNLARLMNEPAISELKAAGLTAVRWLRSGTAPEVRDVTFDVKPSGATEWTRLGTAARIPGGWELSGLTFPASGQIRAQAYAGNSVMEAITATLTPLEAWRLQHFNTPDNTGPAADDADPDHDGLTNFTEFAFDLDPLDRASNGLPEFKYTNNSLTATFVALQGREDIQYSAESSSSLSPGTWTVIPDTGAMNTHTFVIPAGEARVFVRFVFSR